MSIADLREVAGWILLAGAMAFLIGGAIGALALRDPLARLHATRLATGFGAALFLAGLAAIAPPDLLAPLAGLALACLVVGPALVHLMAATAFDRARERGGR